MAASNASPERTAAAVIALPRWQRLSVWWTLAAVAASGIGWLAVAWPDGAATPAARTAATWLLRLHGSAVYVLLVVAGSVLPVHLRLGWARHRNRVSGGALAALLVALAASGLWLYYGPADGREAVSLAHWIAGLALPAWLLLHRALGLRSRRR